MASAAGASSLNTATEKTGIDRGGSCRGRAPTMEMPVWDSPMKIFSSTPARLPKISAKSRAGALGHAHFASIPVPSVTKDTSDTIR